MTCTISLLGMESSHIISPPCEGVVLRMNDSSTAWMWGYDGMGARTAREKCESWGVFDGEAVPVDDSGNRRALGIFEDWNRIQTALRTMNFVRGCIQGEHFTSGISHSS